MQVLITLIVKNLPHKEIISTEGFEDNDLKVELTVEGYLKIILPLSSKLKIPKDPGFTMQTPTPQYSIIEFEMETIEDTKPKPSANKQ